MVVAGGRYAILWSFFVESFPGGVGTGGLRVLPTAGTGVPSGTRNVGWLYVVVWSCSGLLHIWEATPPTAEEATEATTTIMTPI